MYKERDLCPKCDRGHLFNLDEYNGAVMLSCDSEDCQYMVSTDGVPRCPECFGSGVYKGSHKSDIGLSIYACYSCQHEFEAPAPKDPGIFRQGISDTLKFGDRTATGSINAPPRSTLCPFCEDAGIVGYGQYRETVIVNNLTYHLYQCLMQSGQGCRRQFSMQNGVRLKTAPLPQPTTFRRPKRDLENTHLAERCMAPWQPPARWREYAQEGPLGVLYWWPKGLSQERRESFLNDAIALLRMTGPATNLDEETYAVADNLFRLWWEGIAR